MSIETLREHVKQAVADFFDKELSEAEEIRIESIRHVNEEDDGGKDDEDDDMSSSSQDDDEEDDDMEGDKGSK